MIPNIDTPYTTGPIIVGQDGTEVFYLNQEDIKVLRRLPQEIRGKVNENIHKYIEQVGKDYPEK